MADNKHLQLLRSSQAYTDLAAAKKALEGKLATLKDGEPAIASYGSGASAGVVLGIRAFASGSTGTNSIFIDAATIEGLINKVSENSSNALSSALSNLIHSTTGSGPVVTDVTQANGKVSVTKGNLTASQVTRLASGNVTGATVEAALLELQNKITNSTKTYTIKSVATGELAANSLAEYQLIENGKVVADAAKIVIPKDQYLKDVTFNTDTQKLTFKYSLADGTEKSVDVNMASIVVESEVGNGLQVGTDKAISVKLDTDNENGFLTVGTGGLKLSGVQSAINTAKGEAIDSANRTAQGYASTAKSEAITSANSYTDAQITATKKLFPVITGGTNITVTPTTAEGNPTTYTVNASGLATSTDLTNLSNKVNGLTAKNIKATTITSGDTTIALTGATVDAQLAELAKGVKTAQAAANAVTVKGSANISVTKSNTGSEFTVSAIGLATTGEVSTAKTEAINSAKSYTDEKVAPLATTEALNAAKARITTLEGKQYTISGASGVTVTGTAAAKTISVKLDANNENGFLTVGTGGLKLSGVQSAINTAKNGAVADAKAYTDKKVAPLATTEALNAAKGRIDKLEAGYDCGTW